MKRWMMTTFCVSLTLAVFWVGVACAEYPTGKKTRSRGDYSEEGFDAVDLSKFRRGNPEWDTQELIASGLTALHKDNEKILKELEDLKVAMQKIEGGR